MDDSEENRDRYAGFRKLLREWMDDPSDYDERAWEEIKKEKPFDLGDVKAAYLLGQSEATQFLEGYSRGAKDYILFVHAFLLRSKDGKKDEFLESVIKKFEEAFEYSFETKSEIEKEIITDEVQEET